MKIHLSRWVCTDVESNLARLRDEALSAAKNGAEIAVFPELFLTGYTRPLDPQSAREVFTEVSAASPETLFVFGSISEAGRNRVTVWNGGYQLALYDKVHLFHPNGEDELWEPGQSYVAFEWRDLRIGLMNCNDIRFPEQARALKLEAHCDLLVVPAWWPWRRDHIWSTLLQARAAENLLWVLGWRKRSLPAPATTSSIHRASPSAPRTTEPTSSTSTTRHRLWSIPWNVS
jgi:predicted amidohydrolase